MPHDSVAADVERRVREAAKNRCGYCLSPQHLVMARLEIEHIQVELPVESASNDFSGAIGLRRGTC
jgi:hypothetical protein